MFHRVTTEDHDKPEQQPANANTAEQEQPEERALYSEQDDLSDTSQSNQTESEVETATQYVEPPKRSFTPSYTPQKAKYSTSNIVDRGTKMTSYTRTQSNETSGTETQTHDFSAGSYSRTRSTGGYPGASSYTPSATTRSPAKTAAGENDRTLTIGAGITMAGEIESCDYLLVEGTVEAALKGARSLEVAESGVFYGTVEIEEATIAGRFEGDITVHGRLTIQSTGVVTGSITYKELEIESGAVVDGRLTPVSSVQQSQNAPVATKTRAPVAQQKTIATGDNTPANTDAELFASDAEPTAAE